VEQSIRVAVMGFLHRQSEPVTRAQVAAAMPERNPNSVNRMLLDLVRRGTVVQKEDRFLFRR
jgi:DNA-binding IclR family transcriptional regulator